MDFFIGSKTIQATPMTQGEFKARKQEPLPTAEEANVEGYMVVYEDGCVSWSPATVFCKSYLRIGKVDASDRNLLALLGENTQLTHRIECLSAEVEALREAADYCVNTECEVKDIHGQLEALYKYHAALRRRIIRASLKQA